MAKPIIMPQVGQDIETAVILEWHVHENDRVNKGDILFVVESDKAVFEIEADVPGVLLKILYNEGEEAKVFEPVAYIGAPGETIDDIEMTDDAVSQRSIETTPPEIKVEKHGGIDTDDRIHASPSARRLARQHGIDLAVLHGTGPNGRIRKQDVMAASETVSADVLSAPQTDRVPQPKPQQYSGNDTPTGEDTEIRFTSTRKTIAARLTLSIQTKPHFYIAIDADMTNALEARKQFNRNTHPGISVNDILIHCTASALAQYPVLNAYVDDEKLTVKKNINIGVAVSTDEGVLIPVVPDADKKDIGEISRISRDLIHEAQKGIVRLQAAGTFTISNMSMYMIDYVLPVINPPECAVLGAGRIEKRVVPIDRQTHIGIRDMMTLTIACDHRAVDGVYASRFLKLLKRSLEKFSI